MGQQFLVRTGLNKPSVLHHHHRIRGGGLRQPVRDHHGRSACQGSFRGLVKHGCRTRSCLRRRFVQNGDRRVLEQEPCKGYLLRLLGGELVAAGTYGSLQSVVERFTPSGPYRVQDLPQFRRGSVRLGEPEVLGEGAGEDMHFLAHHGNALMQLRGVGAGGIEAPHQGSPALGLFQAHDDLGQCGLACP